MKKISLGLVSLILILSFDTTFATTTVIRNDGGTTCNAICAPKSCVIVGYNIDGSNSVWHADVGGATGGAFGNCAHDLAVANWMNCRCCVSPTDGGWSTTSWGACNPSTGTQTGTRTCTNPSPNCGGAACSGSSTFNQVCLINASCGTADGGTFSAAPSSDLCAAGSASAVSDTGQWEWTCSGFNGGSDTSCSASKPFLDIGLKINENGTIKSVAVWPSAAVVPLPHLKIFKDGIAYKIVLVDPASPTALKLKIQTSSGIKHLSEF